MRRGRLRRRSLSLEEILRWASSHHQAEEVVVRADPLTHLLDGDVQERLVVAGTPVADADGPREAAVMEGSHDWHAEAGEESGFDQSLRMHVPSVRSFRTRGTSDSFLLPRGST